MKRNYGIDLLRILLMQMIVMLHILGDGGVLEAVTPLSLNYNIAWLIESLVYCAVNGYALISGYVHIDAKYKISSLVMLWLQTIFYTIGIMIMAWLINPDLFFVDDLWDACFPISRGTYWYLSAYVGLFILIPFLNAAIHAIPEQKMKSMILLFFTVFSFYATFCSGDPFTLNKGYSVIWLALLYILGACIKTYGWGTKFSVRKALGIYTITVGISWLVKLLIEGLTMKTIHSWNGNILIDYTSPTMVLAATALFLAFQKIKLSSNAIKLVQLFSPAAFGVYLIHKQEYVSGHFIRGRFAAFAQQNVIMMVFGVVVAAVIVFVICILIDRIRYQVFRLLRISQRLEKLDGIIYNDK